MLVLSGKAGDIVKIGDDIEIVHCGLDKHGKYRLGITAPKSLVITRMMQTPKGKNEAKMAKNIYIPDIDE